MVSSNKIINVKLLAQSFTQEVLAIEDEQMRQNLVKSRIFIRPLFNSYLKSLQGGGAQRISLFHLPKGTEK